MPEVELRADFDRDGRLTGSAAEYAARATAPGAVLGPNLDRDGRPLVATPQVVRTPQLDFALPAKRGGDEDPIALQVVVSPKAVSRFASLALRIEGDDAGSVALLDGNSRVLTPLHRTPTLVEFGLPARAGTHRFGLEARRVAGSPLGAVDGSLKMSAIGRDAAGSATAIDEGRLLLAGFVVAGDLAPAEALYIAELSDNFPARTDVREGIAATRPKVPVRVVRPADNRGDGWLQDQFQLGYILAPGRRMRAVLHLPRLDTNAQIGANQRNLADLVRSHFPSTDLGLIEDFWQRTVPLVHQGGVAQLSFLQSSIASRITRLVERAHGFLLQEVQQLCAAAEKREIAEAVPLCEGLPEKKFLPMDRLQIPGLLRRVEELVRLLSGNVAASEAGSLEALLRRARRQAQIAETLLPVSGPAGQELFGLAIEGTTYQLDDDSLFALAETVKRMHDSLVYGGNIEASPPTRGHSFGKVVIGSSEVREMDPELRSFFEAGSAVQPVVAIDTSWLGVGHVDELISFLPDRGGRHANVVMRASPEVAAALVAAGTDLYLEGLPWYHPDVGQPWRPLTIQRHRMGGGKHPMTRLFRGKLWLHLHPRRRSDYGDGDGGAQVDREVAQVLPPPGIYQELVKWYDGLFSDSLAPYLSDSTTDVNYYKAALSARDIGFFENGANELIVEQKLVGLDETLEEEFPDFPIRRLPVFFDLVEEPTAAFTPNLVNFQFVDGTVLIPNPFGPRMLPADAARVVAAVLREEGLGAVAGAVSPTFFRRQRLDVTEIWINPMLGEGTSLLTTTPFATLADLADEFADGFGTATRAQVEARIRAANRAAFDPSGNLRPGWRKLTIPERTVDLFQAYTHAILVAQGLTPVWVDSWFYHVRFGEIHCGTNVLRKLPRGGRR